MNQQAVPDEAREVELGHFDPYKLDPAHILEPPTSFGEIVRKTGPGIVLAASIVGSGELILTTTLGAKVGYAFMWMILLSCLIKSVVQSCLGRYAIGPPRPVWTPSTASLARAGGSSWVVWAWAAMVFMTLFQITGMFIGVSQTMNMVFARISVKDLGVFVLDPYPGTAARRRLSPHRAPGHGEGGSVHADHPDGGCSAVHLAGIQRRRGGSTGSSRTSRRMASRSQ